LCDITRDAQTLYEFPALGLPLLPVTVVGGVPVQGYHPTRLAELPA
jgi:hypothetical protein